MPLPRPPSADPLVALADQCVQCGLCLPACPTYRQRRIEAESPRGRIALARGWALHALEPTAAGDAHLDACLACRSCEAVCPAGVRYGELLAQARRRQRARRPATVRQRVIEALVRRRRMLTVALAAYRAIFDALPRRLRPLPRPPAPMAAAPPAPPPATPPPTARVALFVGCVARSYEPSTRAALRRLLSACGVEVAEPAAQGCCGALHAHAGAADEAGALMRRNAAAFAGWDTVLTLASGCHESVAGARAGASTVDALDELARRAGRLRFRASESRVGLHLPCTQRNVVPSVPALRSLLARVPGLTVVELDAGDGCCGASGTLMLADAQRAAAFRAPLLAQAADAGIDQILSANLGCRLHFANGTPLPVRHPLDFLADQLDGSAADAQ